MSVHAEKSGPVTTIIMQRPDVRNAVDPSTADALVAEFEAFNRDPQAQVAVFFGSHGSFCAGWDLKYGASLAGKDARRELNLEFPQGEAPVPRGPMGPSRLELDKPVIGAIAGAAVAGGMELALWCDLRVMEEDAYFGVYCRRWGVPLIDGGTVRLPRIVGMGRAMDIILTGRKIEAEEAYRIGLCERVVPHGRAREAAEALALEIARFPQGAVRADRRSAYRQHGRSVRAAMEQEWASGADTLAEAISGAGRFASGRGRHGAFDDI
jgi:enoyl-CoA hydratase